MANLQMCGLAKFVRLAELSQIWQFVGFAICGLNFCGRKTFANTLKIVFHTNYRLTSLFFKKLNNEKYSCFTVCHERAENGPNFSKEVSLLLVLW